MKFVDQVLQAGAGGLLQGPLEHPPLVARLLVIAPGIRDMHPKRPRNGPF